MIAAFIQARMGSTRFPGKTMAPLAGLPLIEHVVTRVHASTLLNYVCVCTTEEPEDDVLAAHVATLRNTGIYRGARDDVLGRFAGALRRYPDADAIVRITADDPFVDPTLIDHLITAFLSLWGDTDNRDNPEQPEPPHYMQLGGLTWPCGLGVEIVSRWALETAAARATDPEDREHVTPWMARHLAPWILKDDQHRGSVNTRWTIDTIGDYADAVQVYAQLYPSHHLFGYAELVAAQVRGFGA